MSGDRPGPPATVRDALDHNTTGPLTPLERLILVTYVHLRSEANRAFTPVGVAALLGHQVVDVHRAGHELYLRGLIHQ